MPRAKTSRFATYVIFTIIKCKQSYTVDVDAIALQVDESLAFLNAFVSRALAQGAVPYSPQLRSEDDDDDSGSTKTSAFKMTPYERPSAPPVNMGIMSGLAGAQQQAAAQIPGSAAGITQSIK